MSLVEWRTEYQRLNEDQRFRNCAPEHLQADKLSGLLAALGLLPPVDVSELLSRHGAASRLNHDAQGLTNEEREQIVDELATVETWTNVFGHCLTLWDQEREKLSGKFVDSNWSQVTLGFELETKWITLLGKENEPKKNLIKNYYEKKLLFFKLNQTDLMHSEGEALDGAACPLLEHVTAHFAMSDFETRMAAIRTAIGALRHMPKGTMKLSEVVKALNTAMNGTGVTAKVANGFGDVKVTFTMEPDSPGREGQPQGNYSFPLCRVGAKEGLRTLFKDTSPAYAVFCDAAKKALAFLTHLTTAAKEKFPDPTALGLGNEAAAQVWPWSGARDLEYENLHGLFTFHLFNTACHRWMDANVGTMKDNFSQLVKTPAMDVVRQALLPHTRAILADLFLGSVKANHLAQCKTQLDAYYTEMATAPKALVNAKVQTSLQILTTALEAGSVLDELQKAVKSIKLVRENGFSAGRILALSYCNFVPGLTLGFYDDAAEGGNRRYETAPSEQDRHKSMRRLGICPSSNPLLPQERTFKTAGGGTMTLHSIVVEARHGSDVVSKILSSNTTLGTLKSAVNLTRRASVLRAE